MRTNYLSIMLRRIRSETMGWRFLFIGSLVGVLTIGPIGYARSDALLSDAYDAAMDREEIFERANEYSQQKEWDKALEGYLYLANLGIQNGYLFYNLGNTYFVTGQIGPAMLWYERALRYLPRYEDLKVNYQYARDSLVDEEFRSPNYGGTLGLLIGMHRHINLRESLTLTLLVFWLFAGCLAMYLITPVGEIAPWLRIPCWILGIAFILLCFSSAFKAYQYEYIHEAIVMESAVEIKTGPGKDFSTAFTLHEGTKVILKQTQNDWVQIVLPGNQSFTGWIPAQSIETI